MANEVLAQSTQAALLSATSNVLAQVVTAYRDNKPISFDYVPILRFTLFTFLNTPPNVLWQQFLEHKFPTHPRASVISTEKGSTVQGKPAGQISKSNVAKKFMLDQTLGAVVNTAIFIAAMRGMEGKSVQDIKKAILREGPPLMKAGLKLWPLVSILAFTLVPVNRRVIFGSAVGLFWGIYLSLMEAAAH